MQSLYLDYYFYDKRSGKITHKHSFLKLYVLDKPRTEAERQEYDNTYKAAEELRRAREIEFKNRQTEGLELKSELPINFIKYFQAYINDYTKKDVRMLNLALVRFKSFLLETPKYKMFADFIEPHQLNKDMMIAFTDYLKKHGKGEGPSSIYLRFKKVIKYAVEHDVMQKSPCDRVTIRVDRSVIKKEVLSVEEIAKLEATHYQFESDTIRRAFIFCCWAGLRHCDVEDITYRNVDFANKRLKYDQNKTKDTGTHSWVVLPIKEKHLELIGKQPKDLDTKIFPLPSEEACNKALKRWTARAGIDKHITWHCARHSFATNLIIKGLNPVVVQKFMGHSDIKNTLRYITISDEQKMEAMDKFMEGIM